MVSVLICDFDDTLAHTSLYRQNLLLRTLREVRADLSLETLLFHWGNPFESMIRSMVPEIDMPSFLEIYERAMSRTAPEPTLGAKRLLQAAAASACRVIVFSSSLDRLVRADLRCLHFADLVDDVWCSDRTNFHKPDPRSLEPLLSAIELQGVRRKDVAYVGDSVSDYLVAKGCSIEFYGVLFGQHSVADFLRSGLESHRIFYSLSQVAELLFPEYQGTA